MVKKWLWNVCVSMVGVLAPIKAILLTVGVLIVFDLITGLMAARKRKESLSSAGLRRSISKLVVYQIAVISAFLVEVYMVESVLPISKFVAGLIGMVELTSIFENINVFFGKNMFVFIIQKFGSINDKKYD
jgi:phage-related holin